MSKARSPSYPAISLKEAVDRVAMIYSKDYQNPIPRNVAAEHMGYQSLNGKSLGVLSALLKFGLLEGRGDDTRVSDLGLTICAYGPGNAERSEALMEAARRPELFAELDDRFQGGKASDSAIRSYLLTQKFIPSGADAAVRTYRETKQFVAAESVGYGGQQAQEEHPMLSAPIHTYARPQPPSMQQPGSMAAAPSSQKMTIVVNDETVTVSAVLSSGREIARLIEKLTALKVLLPDDPPQEATGDFSH